MDKTIVSSHAGWNPEDKCWQFTDTYWQEGYIHDLEWEGDDCHIRRVDICLWIEISCFDKDKKGELILRKRSRERQRCYVLAERYCKETRYEVWTEDADLEGELREEWDIESEYWK